MRFFWSRIRRDRFFLTRYLLGHAVVLAILWGAVTRWGIGISGEVPVLWGLAMLPVTVWLGLKIPTVTHNCMHANLSRGNLLVGELTSFYILMSFGIVCTLHALHHADPDSDRDPHSPNGKSFARYLMTSQFLGVSATRYRFLEVHGDTAGNRALFAVATILHFAGGALRLAIWAQLLGPLLIWAYAIPYASYLFVFAHVNYVTHGHDEQGRSIVRNRNSNLYYRLINAFCDGIYFHEDHHRFPRRYDPRLVG